MEITPACASGGNQYNPIIYIMANYCSPNIQRKLTDLYSIKPYRSNTGMLDFAYSPANGSGLQAQVIGPMRGKSTNFSITYRQSVCTTVVACDQVECTDTGTATNMTSCDNYTSFSCYSSEWHVAEVSAFRDLGSMEVQEVISGHVYDQMQKIKDAIDTATVVAVQAAKGQVTSAVASKTLKLIDDATKAPVWAVDASIKLDFADAGYPDMPILIGNRTVGLWRDAVSRSGINQYGQRLDTIDNMNAFYDININSTNAPAADGVSDTLFAILPGVVNVLTWSGNVGQFASRNNSVNASAIDPTRLINTDGMTFEHSMLVDPATGMVFDFDIVYDPKCKKFLWKVSSYYKVIVLPLVGCKDSTFNGIVSYNVCPVSDVFCNNP